MANRCPNCRQPVSAQAGFCSTCGTRVVIGRGFGVLKGVLIALGLLFVVGIFTSRIKRSADTAPQLPTGILGSTQPLTSAPTAPPKEHSADIGETFSMRRPAVCGDTPEGLDEITKWLGRNDREEAARAMLRHGGAIIDKDQSVKVLDRTGFLVQRSKIRILKTDHECWLDTELTEH